MATNANTAGATDGSMVKQLDAILEVLQNLLIIEGHEAGMKKAKVRAIVKVADAKLVQKREAVASGLVLVIMQDLQEPLFVGRVLQRVELLG